MMPMVRQINGGIYVITKHKGRQASEPIEKALATRRDLLVMAKMVHDELEACRLQEELTEINKRLNSLRSRSSAEKKGLEARDARQGPDEAVDMPMIATKPDVDQKHPKHPFSFEPVWVTPELAAQWMSRNASNRPFNKANCARIKRDLQEGKWVDTGDPVRFDKDGRLIDGQHRVTAIAETGISVWLMVVRDLPTEAFYKIDVGKSRTGPDVLVIEGFPLSQAAILSTAARHAIHHEQTGNPFYGGSMADNQDIILYVRSHPLLIQSSEVIRMLARTAAPISKGAGCFLHFLFSQKDGEQADDFIERLFSGAGLERTDPAFVVREAINRAQLTRQGWTLQKKAFAVARAWNWTRKGKPCNSLGNLLRDPSGSFQFPEIL